MLKKSPLTISKKHIFGQFELHSHGLGAAQRNLFWIEGLHSGLIILGVNLGMLAVLLIAIPKVASGVLDGRLLAVLTLGAAASFEAILPLPLAFQNLESSLQAGHRLFELIEHPDKTPPITIYCVPCFKR